MRTIILYGHEYTVQSAYAHLDALLRERRVRDVAVIQTTQVTQTTAHALRDAGGELWYCGPTLTPPGGGWSPVCADRYLLSACWGSLGAKVLAAINEFMGKTRVAM